MDIATSNSDSNGEMLAVLERHTRLILLCAVGGALIAVGWQVFKPRHYTAYASFIGQSKRGGSPLAGFAAQFGLAGIGSDGAQSPQFFSDLVKSPGVLREVVKAPYSYVQAGRQHTGNLIDLYELDSREGTTPDVRLQHAAEHLEKQISTSLAPKTGLISLEVRAPDPELATQIAKTIIEKVDAVNLRLRQSQAQADRQFAEMRVTELGSELHAAENRLQQFMQTNKDFHASPRLALEQERLSREVEMRQSVYASMAAAYEQDRIESVRDNPVVTVVDLPIRPAKPDSRGIAKGFFLGAFLGGMLATLGAYLLDTWKKRKAEQQGAIVTPSRLYETAGVQ